MKVVILTEEQAALIAEFITGPGKFCASQPCTPSDEPINGEPCIYKQNKLLPLLTPVEIPEGEGGLVGKIIMLFGEAQIRQTDEAITQALAEAAAMIDAYAKQVPEKLLSIIYNMPPEFYSDWLDHAKEICQDFGYTVKEST